MSNQSDILLDLILTKHKTIVAFAAAAGIERAQVYRLLSGKGMLLETAQRVAEALDITLDELTLMLRDRDARSSA